MTRPVLNFYDPHPDASGQDVLRTKAVPGTHAVLSGAYPDLADGPPDEWPAMFTVYATYQNVLRRLWTHFPQTKPGVELASTYVDPATPGVFRGVNEYVATFPEPPDKPTDARFVDDLGNRSGLLRVRQPGQQTVDRDRRAQFAVDPAPLAALAQVPLPPGVLSLNLGRGRRVHMDYEIRAGADPSITVTVLTPWGSGDSSLQGWLFDTYLPGLSQTKGISPQIADDFAEEFGRELSGEPVADIAVEETEFHLEESASHAVRVILDAAQPGPLVFALRLVNQDTGDVSVSDMALIEVIERDDRLGFVEQLWVDVPPSSSSLGDRRDPDVP